MKEDGYTPKFIPHPSSLPKRESHVSTAGTISAGPPTGQPFPIPPAIRPERTLSPGQWGMVSFLVSEVALFGTLIVTYVFYLGKDTVGPTPAEALRLSLVVCTTVCLLASSATVHMAERTLEWATTSPPPAYNFEVIPTVHSRRPLWDMKYPDDPDWRYESF